MKDYSKYLGKRVIIGSKGYYFGYIGTLINVVNNEWYSHEQMGHITLDHSINITIPMSEVILFKELD